MQDYSTQAFLLQWEHFVALRGHPLSVRSDRGSQLLSGKNYVAWEPKEDPKNWKWDKIAKITARSGTIWDFIPAGSQYKNGLAEARVKATKSTLQHVLATSIVLTKPTINYAELTVLLSRVSNIINDRPLGVRLLSSDELVPVTPNMLLLGRTGGSVRHHTMEETEDFGP